MNYVGVVLGPSVSYDEEQECLVIGPNLGAYAGIEGIENVNLTKEQIVLNSINILMKRGVKALYLYASDESLRRKLLKLQRERV